MRRCIHYDRPLESRGAADLPQAAQSILSQRSLPHDGPQVAGQKVCAGAEAGLLRYQDSKASVTSDVLMCQVRLVNLTASEATLNGLKAARFCKQSQTLHQHTVGGSGFWRQQ